MKFKTLIISIIALLPFFSNSQLTEFEVKQMANSADEKQLVVEASRMLQENYYYFSGIIVDKLLEFQPENSNYNYRKGFIELGSNQDYITALPYFEKAIQEISKNYDMYSHKETGAPIDAYFHMGRCYHLNEEIEKAKEYYNTFLEESRGKSELIPQAELALVQCDNAKHAIANPKSAIVKNIGETINTENPEYSPVVSLDGSALYFTSRRQWADYSTDDYRDPKLYQYPEDIYVSYKDFEDNWTSPEKMNFCDGRVNEATIAVSSKEGRIYAYKDVTGNGDIYFSPFENNEFKPLEEIDRESVNTKYWETHCTVTPDGENMYFVSDRPGGFGGRDIYRIVKMSDGSWSEPKNLGEKINTAYDEDSPFLAVDNKTMYFASNGPNSIGGFDIFVSVRNEDNVWSEPINLGYPINRTGDDLFYTTTVDGLKGYLSSFRDDGHGEKDIYEVENDYMGIDGVVVLNGKIKTLDNTPVPENAHITLECINCLEENDPERLVLLPGASDAEVTIITTPLKQCKEYEIVFMENESDVIRKGQFTTSCNTEYEEIYEEAFIGEYRLIGSVSHTQTGIKLSDATVEIMDASEEIIATHTTGEKGNFASPILKKKERGDKLSYKVRVKKEGFLAKTFNMEVELKDEPVIKWEFVLDQIEVGTDVGKLIEINPIYFDLDKSNIRPDAEVELNKIVKVMQENPTIKIELGSHTDCRASKAYNRGLSDRRAKSSAKYIRERIDDPSRIYGKGYGESQLVNDCECEGSQTSDCSEEEHQANRRTEFRIVKL